MGLLIKVSPFFENVFGSLKKFVKGKRVTLNLTGDFVSNFILKFRIETLKELF